MQEPLKDHNMEEMIEAFFDLSDGDNDETKEYENDPIIEHL